MGLKQALLLTTAFAASAGVSAAEATQDDVRELFHAYSEQDFTQVRKMLSSEGVKSAEFRFVNALALLHDKQKQRIEQGFPKLAELYQDQTVPAYLRTQLDLCYARAAQLIDTRRDIYPDLGKDVDFLNIYNRLIQENPGTEVARNAMFFELDYLSNQALASDQNPDLSLESLLGNHMGEQTEAVFKPVQEAVKLLQQSKANDNAREARKLRGQAVEILRNANKSAERAGQLLTAAVLTPFISNPDNLNYGNVLRRIGIVKTENFINTYAGDPRYLVPLHLLLYHLDIAFFKNYESAVKHLIAVDEIGITNPRMAQSNLYQIARVYQLWLLKTSNGRENAIKYFKMYIEKYPLSNLAPVASRIIRDLEAQ